MGSRPATITTHGSRTEDVDIYCRVRVVVDQNKVIEQFGIYGNQFGCAEVQRSLRR